MDRGAWIRAALAVTLLALPPASAAAQSSLQVSPDGSRTLISKEVGGERWSITASADGTVTGNVYRPDGGAPSFVSCVETVRADGVVLLRCQTTEHCAPWQDVGEVALPESFFAPPASCASASPAGGTAPAPSAAPSALRMTPSERTVLISKDVDGRRWAITSHVDDGVVTGNVFSADGGPTEFVWCENLGGYGGDVTLACRTAAACTCGSCPESSWTPAVDVVLPTEFVDDRRCADDAPPPRPAPRGLLSAGDQATRGFGFAVAATDELVAVGGYSGGNEESAAFVFERTRDGLGAPTRLLPADLAPEDLFAIDLAAGGGTIAVSSISTAHVFERRAPAWQETERVVLPLDGERRGEITAIAVDGDVLAFGAGYRTLPSEVQVHERTRDGWRLAATLHGDGLPPDAGFASALALSGDTLVVGARSYGYGSTGYVVVYERRAGTWTQVATLSEPSDRASDGYGRAVAVDGDTLVVGAQPDVGGYEHREGSAFVYERREGAWSRTARLAVCDREVGLFGDAVAVSDGLVAVGAHDFVGGAASGDVWVFERGDDGRWRQKGRVVASDAAPSPIPNGAFVAFAGPDLVVGVPAAREAWLFDAASELVPPEDCRPEPPRPLFWPEDEWRVEAPSGHGMSAELLERARQYAFAVGRNTQGVVVARDGVIVGEWYSDFRGPDSYGASWSVAKSFVSAVVGIALGEGLIDSVDAPMTRFFPEWAGTPKEAITLRHVLSMASGLDWDENYAPDPSALSDIGYMAAVASDQLAFAASQPLLYPPGTFYSYSSGDSMLLSGVLEGATGTTAGAYAQQVLFEPIGMAPVDWWTDAVGHTLTYCCIDTPSRDFARFGLLYARGGRWKDRQVVPEAWVRESTSPTAVATQYGYQWRLGLRFIAGFPDDAFMALGYDGQFVYVFPSLDLVVVRNGHYDKDPGPPIADPNLYARYPAAGLVPGRGTVPPISGWDHEEFLRPILDAVVD